MVLVEVILPILLVVVAGFVYGRVTCREPKLLVDLAFYLLTPALIFRSVYTSTVAGGHLLTIALFVLLLQAVLFAFSRVGGRLLKWDGDTRAAGSLVMTFANSGIYGLPVLLFAFGEQGFHFGVVYMLASMFLQATLGVGIASWRGVKDVVRWIGRVLRVPWLYVFAVALLLRAFEWRLPEGAFKAVDLLASAAIPLQLLLLGVQLARIPVRRIASEAVWLAGWKLLIPPLLAWGLTSALGVDGLLRSVLIVEASMPAAINAMILSMHYKREPELVATVVLVTTALSLVTLTILLSILT
ncbi:AEC family transporter [Candidatus Bipolaricaulota bacterium]